MKVPVRFFVALSVLALAVFSIPMLAQNQTYPFPGYPPEFAPSRTSRPVPTPFPRSASKFHKVDHAVTNQYIVVLNDDAVPQGSTGAERRASVTEIAKRMLPPGAEIQSEIVKMRAAGIPEEDIQRALEESSGLMSKYTNVKRSTSLERFKELGLQSGDTVYVSPRKVRVFVPEPEYMI